VNTDAGELIPEYRLVSIDREKMKTMAALLHDSNLIHLDPTVVEHLGMGDRLVNQGPTNLAYTMNMLAAWGGGFERITSVDVRFLANVFSGDSVTATGRVLSRTRGSESTVAECAIRLDGPDGAVLEGTATVSMPE